MHSNELQDIRGEIGVLPVFTQWSQLQLMEQEVLLLSSEDMSCAFYLFALPTAWLPYFALDGRLSESSRLELGLAPGKVFAAVRVIPMGWVSATGICQHLHQQLRRQAMRRIPLARRLPEISRETALVTDHEERLREYPEV